MRRLHRVVVFFSAALVLPPVGLAQTGLPGPVITIPQGPPPPRTPPPGTPPRDRSGRPQEAVAGTAVISGRVLDAETGQPLRRVNVQAFLTTAPTPRTARTFEARTDDTGAYTIRELPAGVYTVVAQRGGYVMQTLGQSSVNSPPRRLTIEDRGKLTGIDFKLQPGGVIDADVMSGGFSGRGIMQDGTFAVTGVTPGAYTLHVMVTPQRPMASPDEFAQMESAALPIVVGGEDLENLTVTTSPPSSVSGRVIVEGDVGAIQPSGLRVMSRPVEIEPGMMFGPPGQGAVQDDFTVTLTGLRGSQVLLLNGLPRGWWVKAVRVNGQNALDGFDFASGRKWTGLEIVVNNRPASIGGQVIGADGQPASNYIVVAYPQDYESRTSIRLPGLGGIGTPDQHGGFVIENLRPGVYFGIALPAGEADYTMLEDPDRLRELSQRATPITIREGEQQFLNLKLEP